MRKGTGKVVRAFVAGEVAQYATCQTDGSVFWSYTTPIACKVGGGYVATDARYSHTTSEHQSAIRQACEPLTILSERDFMRVYNARGE